MSIVFNLSWDLQSSQEKFGVFGVISILFLDRIPILLRPLFQSTQFRHPTDEQLQNSDMFRSHIYLKSVPFEFSCFSGS